MATHNVNLSEHFSQFIRECVDSGRYNNASEVVRMALRVLEQQEESDRMKLEKLRAIAKEGFDAMDQGEYNTYTRESLPAMLERIDESIRARR